MYHTTYKIDGPIVLDIDGGIVYNKTSSFHRRRRRDRESDDKKQRARACKPDKAASSLNQTNTHTRTQNGHRQTGRSNQPVGDIRNTTSQTTRRKLFASSYAWLFFPVFPFSTTRIIPFLSHPPSHPPSRWIFLWSPRKIHIYIYIYLLYILVHYYNVIIIVIIYHYYYLSWSPLLKKKK